jgi:hypothetical protein
MNPAPLDGNVTAGGLADFFAFDATTAITTCATCRHRHPIATLRAYVQAPGMVLRCASCNAVQIRLVRGTREGWLDVRGVDMLAIPGPVVVASMANRADPSRTNETTQ